MRAPWEHRLLKDMQFIVAQWDREAEEVRRAYRQHWSLHDEAMALIAAHEARQRRRYDHSGFPLDP